MDGFLTEVNIKYDMPPVDMAIKRITYSIHNCKAHGAAALKLIHGYGSTGRGGKIRTEARRYLDSQVRKGLIKGYIRGEDFSIFDETTRRSFLLCGELRRDEDLDAHNNGITIVIL